MGALVRPVTWLLGIVLLVVGLLGFFMSSPLLGIFETDSLHNIIHVASGALGLIMINMGDAMGRTFLILFGFVYLVVALIGYVQGNTVLGLIGVNAADNMLHILIAAVCLVIGFGSKK